MVTDQCHEKLWIFSQWWKLLASYALKWHPETSWCIKWSTSVRYYWHYYFFSTECLAPSGPPACLRTCKTPGCLTGSGQTRVLIKECEALHFAIKLCLALAVSNGFIFNNSTVVNSWLVPNLHQSSLPINCFIF